MVCGGHESVISQITVSDVVDTSGCYLADNAPLTSTNRVLILLCNDKVIFVNCNKYIKM